MTDWLITAGSDSQEIRNKTGKYQSFLCWNPTKSLSSLLSSQYAYGWKVLPQTPQSLSTFLSFWPMLSKCHLAQPRSWGPWARKTWSALEASTRTVNSTPPRFARPYWPLQAAQKGWKAGGCLSVPLQSQGKGGSKKEQLHPVPGGSILAPAEKFAAFLYAFLINSKRLTNMCNYFLHLAL
jgi:hypothetical protein